MRIGISGGTFDPFHIGHLEPVLAVREPLAWDRVIYVPAWRQPFKLDRRTASGYDRYAMAVLATQDLADVEVSPIELDRAAVSFTVDTLELFHQRWPDAVFDWIIGDDNVPSLEGWKSLPRILELANFVVLARGTSGDPAERASVVPPSLRERVTPASCRGRNGSLVFVASPLVAVSSTAIRESIRAGRPVDAFVDPRVGRYIHQHRLYVEEHT